jgi:galactoside O-acetyltransferase
MQINNNSFFSPAELERLPFKSIGENVLISKKASFYGPDEISIGNNVRIDDFCILSGKVHLGDYIHISAQCLLYGARGIIMGDFSGLSPGCKVFSATDDFSGEHLIGPMVPEQFTLVEGGPVVIGKYVQVGAGSIILPKLDIGEGVAVGSMSLVNTSLEPWGIYAGIPANRIKERSKKIIELAPLIKKG